MLSQELYVKFDLIMISMLNQTSLHPPPWENDGYHVPQATAMSIKQATAIKAVAPHKPVFAYITGYLAQNTFEGGAKFRQPEYSAYWLRDSRGALIDDNWTATHPTNCHCAGYTQSAPGPLWDFRQARVRQFFMDEMVTPMISNKHVDGVFFDDATDIPSYCFAPSPPPSPPPPPAVALNCTLFGCTCQGFANYYGAVATKGWGCCPQPAGREWWSAHHCGAAISPTSRYCNGTACSEAGACTSSCVINPPPCKGPPGHVHEAAPAVSDAAQGGRAPCAGTFAPFTRAEQAASGAATLQHFDDVLGKMAAQDKGVVMSMNPVTDTSFPINSSQGDAMLLKHRAFHFFEFFGDSDIGLALELGAKGNPFLVHFGAAANWTQREYSFATYLIVASEWSYYGMSHGWSTASFPWYPEFDRPLGAPAGPAKTDGAGRYSREFEHVSVQLNTAAKTASVVWNKQQRVTQPRPPEK